MSTVALDTSRTNERLSAFKAEIGAAEPIDNFFTKNTTLDALMGKKKTINGGRQITYPIDSGSNGTVAWFSDYDVFNTSAQDTALTVVYPFVNLGGTIVISWEEIRETAGDDHKIFDLVAHKRKNVLSTMMDTLNSALHATSQVASQITCLPALVASTGSIGGLSASTDGDWAATIKSSGAFTSQGLTDMNNLYNTLKNKKSNVDTIITTQAVYELYEAEVDVDVRYNTVGTANRGFKSIEFKGVPLQFDPDCASGTLYMLNSENNFFMIDTEGNFDVEDFMTPTNQKVSIAKVTFRGNFVCNNRRANGKMTSIS